MKNLLPFVGLFTAALSMFVPETATAQTVQPKIRVMLLTGQCNQYHNWALSSPILKRVLEQPGIFTVTSVVTPPKGGDMSAFKPDFTTCDVVVMDYEGDDWPEPTRQAFADFVRNGGGLVSFHATDNAFPSWTEFNEMIGVGGWGGRTAAVGPKVRWRDGKMVLDDSPGVAGHPPAHDYQITVRAPEHPVMRGLPEKWMHAHDELYSQLRGPAKHLEVLATALADKSRFRDASGEHEPVLMAIQFGRGRIFHTTLGHVGPRDVEPIAQMNCIGFILTLQRGTEWAATGKVTIPVPADFPTAEKTSVLAAAPALDYPPTRTVEASDTYFGRTYKDPYRWLEDLKDKEVEGWFRVQAALANRVLDSIPGTRALADEWMALDKLDPGSYSGIVYENGRVFYKKTRGGENVGRLYYREGWKGSEQLLFDPDLYKTGIKTVVQSFSPSWDGKHVVLGLTSGGAEYSELRVMNVDHGTLLPESIYPSWGPTGWAPDNQSFFYDAGKVTDIKSLEIELNRKTRLHRLGTAVSTDKDFFSNESYPALGIASKEWPSASIDESYPDLIFGYVGTVQAEMRLYYGSAADLSREKVSWHPVIELTDDIVRGFSPVGDYLYAITHVGAPKYKVVRTRIRQPDWAHAETVLGEAGDSVQAIVKTRHYLLAIYSNGIVGRLVKYNVASGEVTEVKLPGSGTVGVSCPDWRTDLCHVVITSWTIPETRYDFDAGHDTFVKSAFNSDVTYPGFSDLNTEEVEVPSHDGTLVPLSIIYQKGLTLDGSHSCILEGYGAYAISYPPYFSVQRSVATRGVVLAYAHPRGGGEKGEAWYKAGYKTTKPNTWRDYIACAEYLVKHGYTSPEHLAGTGTSAGGILISRAVTERPDLFRAAICNVGCANAMRLEFSPNGPINTPEFGTVQIEAECQALFEMDGVQHVRPGVKYPAVLGVAGWNDPRVAPWQPGKFVAALQQAADKSRPALIKVNYDNGHFTEEKQVTFANFAAQTAFLLWQTGHKDFQPRQSP